MKINIKEERLRLDRLEGRGFKWASDLEQQRKLVSALEQLENHGHSNQHLQERLMDLIRKDTVKAIRIKELEEQLEKARETLEYAGKALRLHGCSSMYVDSVLAALKQQEVGNGNS